MSGSVGLTPTSIVVIASSQDERSGEAERDAGSAQAQAVPDHEPKNCAGEAPTAMRTPISATRWRTIVASTP